MATVARGASVGSVVAIACALGACASTAHTTLPAVDAATFFAPPADSDVPCTNDFEVVEMHSVRSHLTFERDPVQHRLHVRYDGRSLCDIVTPENREAEVVQEDAGAYLVAVPDRVDTLRVTLVSATGCFTLPLLATAFDPHRASLTTVDEGWIVAVPTADRGTTVFHVAPNGESTRVRRLAGVAEAVVGSVGGRPATWMTSRGALLLLFDDAERAIEVLPNVPDSFATRPIALLNAGSGAWAVAHVDFHFEHGDTQPARWLVLHVDSDGRVDGEAMWRLADRSTRIVAARTGDDGLEIDFAAHGASEVVSRARLGAAGACDAAPSSPCSSTTRRLEATWSGGDRRPLDEPWRGALSRTYVRYQRSIRVGDRREFLAYVPTDDEGHGWSPTIYALSSDGLAAPSERLDALAAERGWGHLSLFTDGGERSACAIDRYGISILDSSFEETWRMGGRYGDCIGARSADAYWIFAVPLRTEQGFSFDGPNPADGLDAFTLAADGETLVSQRTLSTEAHWPVDADVDARGVWLVTERDDRYWLWRFGATSEPPVEPTLLATIHGATRVEVEHGTDAPVLAFQTRESVGRVPFCRADHVTQTRAESVAPSP